MPTAKKTAAAKPDGAPSNDERPDKTLVQVRHESHDESVNPGVVSLGYLRKFGYEKGWVEVAEATDEQLAEVANSDGSAGQEG